MLTGMDRHGHFRVAVTLSVFFVQEVYGRMRLCNTMLTDHFIPRYLANLETCIDLMADPNSVLAAPEAV